MSLTLNGFSWGFTPNPLKFAVWSPLPDNSTGACVGIMDVTETLDDMFQPEADRLVARGRQKAHKKMGIMGVGAI